MAVKISIATHKGGAGKTSTTVNLAAEFGRMGYKVLVVDLDSQSNGSIHIGKDHPSTVDYTMTDLFLSDDDILEKCIHYETNFKNVAVIYSDLTMRNTEGKIPEISLRPNEEVKMKITDKIDDQFDFIFFDTPPSMGTFTTNALVASDYYIIPVSSGSQYSMYGFSDMYNYSIKIAKQVNPNLVFLGALLVMHDKRLNVCQITESSIKGEVEKLIPVYIPSSTKVNQASMLERSVYDIDKSSKIAREFRRLAKYIIEEVGINAV